MLFLVASEVWSYSTLLNIPASAGRFGQTKRRSKTRSEEISDKFVIFRSLCLLSKNLLINWLVAALQVFFIETFIDACCETALPWLLYTGLNSSQKIILLPLPAVLDPS